MNADGDSFVIGMAVIFFGLGIPWYISYETHQWLRNRKHRGWKTWPGSRIAA